MSEDPDCVSGGRRRLRFYHSLTSKYPCQQLPRVTVQYEAVARVHQSFLRHSSPWPSLR